MSSKPLFLGSLPLAETIDDTHNSACTGAAYTRCFVRPHSSTSGGPVTLPLGRDTRRPYP